MARTKNMVSVGPQTKISAAAPATKPPKITGVRRGPIQGEISNMARTTKKMARGKGL